TALHTLSLHDALPISEAVPWTAKREGVRSIRGQTPLAAGGTGRPGVRPRRPSATSALMARLRSVTGTGERARMRMVAVVISVARSEEHTSELQSLAYL